MNASDIMTRPAITLHADATIPEAVTMLIGHRISGLPVTEPDGTLIGMLTEGDLLRRVELGTGERARPSWMRFLRGPGAEAGDYVRTHSRRVRDLMTDGAVTATADTPLDDVVALMEKHHIKRVPIVENGRVIGIVSRADLLRAIGMALATESSPVDDDPATLSLLQRELDRQPWFTAHNVNLTIQGGIVTLDGVVYDNRVREALRVAAENVSGAPVIDAITVIEPNTGMILPTVL